MEAQYVISAMGAVILLCFGHWLTSLQRSIATLQAANAALMVQISNVETLIAGRYLQREEYRQDLNQIYQSLRQIESSVNELRNK